MKEWQDLLDVADRLLAEDGCPWDREQTLFTLQPYLLEEAHELIEAIDQKSGKDMAEELGDVLYTLIFIAKLGEQQNLFTFSEAVKGETEKLIRRHPHVFKELPVKSTDEIISNWEAIKKQEGKQRRTCFEGIPPTLPLLARGQKIAHRLRKAGRLKVSSEEKHSEHEIGKRLFDLIALAEVSGIDAESALRRTYQQMEKKENTGD